ncbi:MAG: hypothetical protein ACKOW3_01875 [Hyphomicrobium sp.]
MTFMRALLLILFILAIGKVWLKGELYKKATEEAMLSAYRIRAEIGCNDRPQTDPRGIPMTVGKIDWRKASNAEIIIGNHRVNVHIWEIKNPLWKTRYQAPFLKLTLRDQQILLYCYYDIMNSSSEILLE